MENQNSPQQQAADLRMMLDSEPPKQRSSRRSSRGTTLSDIDTMSYDELVAYISDSNSDFADEATGLDGLREEEERAKRAVPYSFASLGKKQPADTSASNSHLTDLSSLRTITPDPQAYSQPEYYQPNDPQDSAQGASGLTNGLLESPSDNTDFSVASNNNIFDAKDYNSQDFKRDSLVREGLGHDGFNHESYNGESLGHDGFDHDGFDHEGFDHEGFDRDGYDREGFDHEGFDREGFDHEGFDREGFDHEGFDRDGYDHDNYDREGYDWEGFDSEGYDRDGFDRDNYDREGYDWEGFNQYGLNRQGFDRDGFDEEGFDSEGYDHDGFDRDNYDREGYDWEGFNQYGLDRQGFNRHGYDAEGYDREGFNSEGFDRDGYDREGFDQYNYDREGYDWEGYDCEGYDYGGFDRDGYDKEGYTRQDWEAAGYKFGPRGEFILSESETSETEAAANEPIGQEEAAPQLNKDSTTRPEPSPEVQAESAPTPVEDDEKVEDIEDDRVVGAEPDHEANEEDLSDQELPEYNFAAAPPARANEVKPQAEPESLSFSQEGAYRAELPVAAEAPHEAPQQVNAEPQVQTSSASELPPEASIASAQPRADVPLFEPEGKLGNMTSPWSYECDYAIDYISGSRRGQRIALLASELGDTRSFTVGSSGERVNDIEVDEPTIANDQALLRYNNGRFTLINFQEDIKINRRIITCGEQVNLMTGDEISLGNTTLVFSERCISEALAEYSIDVVEGAPTDLGKSFPLTKQRSSIGRDRNSDIPLTDQEISRQHCTLTFRAGKFFLQHRSDTNPTFINGVSVPVGGERQITTEDKIQISSRTVLQLVKH